MEKVDFVSEWCHSLPMRSGSSSSCWCWACYCPAWTPSVTSCSVWSWCRPSTGCGPWVWPSLCSSPGCSPWQPGTAAPGPGVARDVWEGAWSGLPCSYRSHTTHLVHIHRALETCSFCDSYPFLFNWYVQQFYFKRGSQMKQWTSMEYKVNMKEGLAKLQLEEKKKKQ